MAKKAFECAEGYDYTQALSISSEKLLKDFDVKHSTITGKQASLYREFAKTVNSAIKQLKDSGITAPVKIPWG